MAQAMDDFTKGMMPDMRFHLKSVLGFFLLIFVCSSAIATDGVSEKQFKNGLTVLVKPDHRSPLVLTSVWYKVGGSYEHSGITGISHALEHMMFKGTKRFGPGEFINEINEKGGQVNAFTSNDYTVYHELLPKQFLAKALLLEADRMQHLVIKKDLFAKEMQVIMEERRMRTDDNPIGLTYERFLAAAYVNSPYHHQTIGWMTDLQNMTAADLRQWYHEWYGPNNAILIVVGDVKPAKVFRLAKRYFSRIPKANLPKLKPRVEVPALGLRQIVVERPAKVPWIIMGFNVPTLVQTGPKSWQPYALDVLSGILSAGDSSRLERELVRDKQIAAHASASYRVVSLHQGLFTVSAVPYAGHSIASVQAALWQQIKNLQKKPVTKAELDRVKAQVVAMDVYAKDSLMSQARELGHYAANGLPWQLSGQYVKRIQAVTAEQVMQVAQRFLVKKNMTVAELSPSQHSK